MYFFLQLFYVIKKNPPGVFVMNFYGTRVMSYCRVERKQASRR